MPAERSHLGDLLGYNAEYRVLICRECRYAIQKSALRSHLLRHKVYRGERERLLASIALLDLPGPDQVLLPHPSSRPISALPVMSGYRCTAPECGYLCASAKRMRCHRSEVHGFADALFFDSARPAKLQTFFRGTKLRYFEVTPAVEVEVTASMSNTSVEDGEDENLAHTTTSQSKSMLPENTERCSSINSGERARTALLDRLRQLPFSMTEAFGRPDNTQDVLVTLSAITSLIECCESSCRSPNASSAWSNLTTWLARTPRRFNNMIFQSEPAALVVLAYWASMLEQVELRGCWFLEGSAKVIVVKVTERLPPGDRAVQCLVEGLTS